MITGSGSIVHNLDKWELAPEVIKKLRGLLDGEHHEHVLLIWSASHCHVSEVFRQGVEALVGGGSQEHQTHAGGSMRVFSAVSCVRGVW